MHNIKENFAVSRGRGKGLSCPHRSKEEEEEEKNFQTNL
jgi:hypothetical protein